MGGTRRFCIPRLLVDGDSHSGYTLRVAEHQFDSLIGRTTEEIRALVGEATGLAAYRGSQVAEWLYRRPLPEEGGGFASDFAAMSDLPKEARAALAEHFAGPPLLLTQKQEDPRDGTVKALARLTNGGHPIECVLLPDEKRVSVCLSTQAGCPMACAFCATGTQGLTRNLSAGEIVAQYLLLQSLSPRRISHIVLMGMGEPLLNYDAVLKAIRILNAECGIAMRHITLSTVGIVPNIEKLAEEHLQLTLAVSLHAPNDALRTRLVPVNKTYPLDRLMAACRRYAEHTGRRLTFEYVLLRGVNDEPEHAHELARLIKGHVGGGERHPLQPDVGRGAVRAARAGPHRRLPQDAGGRRRRRDPAQGARASDRRRLRPVRHGGRPPAARRAPAARPGGGRLRWKKSDTGVETSEDAEASEAEAVAEPEPLAAATVQGWLARVRPAAVLALLRDPEYAFAVSPAPSSASARMPRATPTRSSAADSSRRRSRTPIWPTSCARSPRRNRRRSSPRSCGSPPRAQAAVSNGPREARRPWPRVRAERDQRRRERDEARQALTQAQADRDAAQRSQKAAETERDESERLAKKQADRISRLERQVARLSLSETRLLKALSEDKVSPPPSTPARSSQAARAESAPTDSPWLTAVRRLLDRGKLDPALALAEDVLKADPEDGDALDIAAQALEGKKDARAAAHVRRLLLVQIARQDMADAAGTLGRLLRLTPRPEGAEAEARHYLHALPPNDAPAVEAGRLLLSRLRGADPYAHTAGWRTSS